MLDKHPTVVNVETSTMLNTKRHSGKPLFAVLVSDNVNDRHDGTYALMDSRPPLQQN
jgi:hypothetical protein